MRLDHAIVGWVLAGLAFALAAAGALPWAGGYNDGSRLATAESIIDRGTLVIDDSVYVRPSELTDRGLPPYAPHFAFANRDGTLDKVLVNGHFYSDKPMILAVLTAGAYRALMCAGLPRPDERPDVFCRVATVLTCGLSYAAAVGGMWVLGRRAGLAPPWRLAWLGAFALAGVLPAYTRQVNAGMPQLAAVVGLAVLLSRIAGAPRGARPSWAALVGAGGLAGFAYTLDQGSGPPLLALALAAVAVRTRRVSTVTAFALGALPWVAAHHALNYAVGGVWVPLGLVPEYLEWPGSPFDRSNMTGFARHTPAGLVLYARDLLLAPNGFLVCNPPVSLAFACGWAARPGADRIERAALLGWCAAVWGVYALLSDNAGGECLSVRWFVPLLAPGFWALAHLLATRPTFRPDFAILSVAGLVLGAEMWWFGPWLSVPIPYVREITWAAVGACGVVHAVRFARHRSRPAPEPDPRHF